MFLKTLGWIIAPFVMILTHWNKMKGYSRVIGLIWCFIFAVVLIASNSDPSVDAQNRETVEIIDQTVVEDLTEPSEQQWQESYKQIALNEARTYLELTAAQTLSNERLSYAVRTLKTQATNIIGDEKTKFEELAAHIELNDFEPAKELYISLGGDMSIFHD